MNTFDNDAHQTNCGTPGREGWTEPASWPRTLTPRAPAPPERPGTPTHPNEPRTQAHNAGTE